GVLVDRLGNRLGAAAVGRLLPRASHLPERAQVWAAGLAAVPRDATWLAGERPRPIRPLKPPEPGEAGADGAGGPPGRLRRRRPRGGAGGLGAGWVGGGGSARAHRPGGGAPRLLPRRGRVRPPLLALPRRPLRSRPHPALVPARALRVMLFFLSAALRALVAA